MKICNGWQSFKAEVLEMNMPVVCFGAGMLGVYIENLFVKEKIWKSIDCFLDNDLSKEGSMIGYKDPKIIMSVNALRKKGVREFIMLITCVTFVPIIKQLQRIEEWKDIHCYVYPELNYEIVSQADYHAYYPYTKTEQIPKIIHYCWFGKGEKNEFQKKCIASWKKYCSDYEIIEWNESNYDIYKNRYMQEAYEKGKWAYVTDYARLDILWNYGGVYFDTDVELLKNIDILLQQNAFIAYGEWPVVNSGAGIGCIKGHPLVKEMRDNPRGRCSFLKEDGNCDMTQNCVYETNILDKYGFSHNFQMQYIGDMLVLSPKIIATNSILGCDKYVTEKTLALHHNGESWANVTRKVERDLTREYLEETKENWRNSV